MTGTTLLVALVTPYAIGSVIHLLRSRSELKNEIAHRINLEKQLLEKQCFLHTIIQTEPECVKLLSRNGTVLEINPAGAALMDADTPEQLLGTCIFQVVVEENKAQYIDLTQRVFQGESGSLEFQIESLKGQKRWLETHAVPMRDSAGQIIALLGITRDITTRKQAEDDVRRHQGELARVCRMVTVNEMATTLAHELNQPLCAISNYMESIQILAKRRGRTSLLKLDEIAGKAGKQAVRAGLIIRKIREFASTSEPSMLVCDVNSLIENVINISIAEARERGISVSLALGEGLPKIMADPIQIQQVVLNIVRNGIEAIETVCPVVFGKVSISTSLKGEGKVEVMVVDNGCGLVDLARDKVFTSFYTTKPKGMGMGLSISRTIAIAHGGSLFLEENPDRRGCTARLLLPVIEEELL
ncbi:PAS domain-containing sensor histidine kinase [Thiobacillus thioparus]|uniref:PAS domain-containing sensor histidine kinase n=1 Tax=Thiobacillus thioparus TaxID=931 RepID=UPI00039FDD5D|nr:ATP-binding protein [Thiobacillus thioparus]